jgi:hypothetical protein
MSDYIKPLSTSNGIVWIISNAQGNEIARSSVRPTVFTYSNGSTQITVPGMNRPELGAVNTYLDGSVETVICL